MEKQAEAIKASFDKKVELLDAKKNQYFAFEGAVVDTKTDPALDIQLRACEAIDRMTGVLAPPASTKITVEHTFKMPDWFMTTEEKQVAAAAAEQAAIDVTPQLEGPTE